MVTVHIMCTHKVYINRTPQGGFSHTESKSQTLNGMLSSFPYVFFTHYLRPKGNTKQLYHLVMSRITEMLHSRVLTHMYLHIRCADMIV